MKMCEKVWVDFALMFHVENPIWAQGKALEITFSVYPNTNPRTDVYMTSKGPAIP